MQKIVKIIFKTIKDLLNKAGYMQFITALYVSLSMIVMLFVVDVEMRRAYGESIVSILPIVVEIALRLYIAYVSVVAITMLITDLIRPKGQ